MSDKLFVVGKVITGLFVGLVAAEITAIGANAAIDDCKVISREVLGKIIATPEPVKPKGFFRKGR
jgi:hypothetical protein